MNHLHTETFDTVTLNLVFNLFHLGQGATVIQRRKDGSVNFDQTWEKYENGFGDFQGERNYSFQHHYPSEVTKFNY